MSRHDSPAYYTMANNHLFWLITQKILLLLPWLWLGLFALIVTGAFGQHGSWPSYAQPDPKAIGGLSLLVLPLIVLMMVTLASLPFGLLFTVFAVWQGAPYPINKKHTGLYLIGVLLFLSVVVGDFAGLMTWLLN